MYLPQKMVCFTCFQRLFVIFQPRLSTEREIVLDDVDFSTTGHYRCEVSGDAPMFQTASTEGILYVVGE